MIDDTGLHDFQVSDRARCLVFTLAAISLAACADASPADDAVAAELSSSEVLALCGELRDELQRDDQSRRPSRSTRYCAS